MKYGAGSTVFLFPSGTDGIGKVIGMVVTSYTIWGILDTEQLTLPLAGEDGTVQSDL